MLSRIIRRLFMGVILTLLLALPALAATDEQLAQAEKLKELGLFRGGSYGFELERTPTRLEALIMLERLIGAEGEALALEPDQHPFEDELGWAAAGSYLSYAYQNALTRGISESEFGASDPATIRHYLTFVLRALGYDDGRGDFTYEQAEVKGAELGLIPADAPHDDAPDGDAPDGDSPAADAPADDSPANDSPAEEALFLRSDCVSIAYAALSCTLKDSELTLFQHLAGRGVIPADADLSLSLPLPTEPPEDFVLYERVPILMYHMVAETDQANVLYLDPEDFQDQLDYLAAGGWHTVTLSQLAAHWEENLPLPEKPIVLTFDDGYQSMYTEVFPRLREAGMTATFFLFTDFVDAGGGLTGTMVREMRGGGQEIASHTVSHQILTQLSAKRREEELRDSRRFLEQLTGEMVLTFSYPVGIHNAAVRAQTEAAGYKAAVTTDYGVASVDHNRFALPRIRINQGDGANALRRKLADYGF